MYGMNGWYDWEPVFFFERARYTAALQKQALPIYEGISSGKETLQISYKSTACDHPQSLTQVQWEQCFFEKLRQSRGEDIQTGSTGVGPHRDDLELTINGLSAVLLVLRGSSVPWYWL